MKKRNRAKLVRLSDEIINRFLSLPEAVQNQAINHFKGEYPRVARILRALQGGQYGKA